MTSLLLTPAHSSKRGFLDQRREGKLSPSISPRFPPCLFPVFHSCALTEVNSPVLSRLRTPLTSASGRPGERAAAFQRWPDWTGPRGGHAVPSERALSLSLSISVSLSPCSSLTLKWSPAKKGYATDDPASRHEAARRAAGSPLATLHRAAVTDAL